MRASFPAAIAATIVLALALLVYVFGSTAILRGSAWAGFGAVLGWVGSLILRSDTQRDILRDIFAGAVGTLCGLLLFGNGSLVEGGPLERTLSAIVGAVVLVAVAAVSRRRP